MKITVTNFKSINYIELELAPLTILLGPPASGKSNILDALALIGYFNRFLLMDREYDNNAANFEPLTLISRFNEHSQLFKCHDLTRRISISVANDGEQSRLNIYYSRGRMNIDINNVVIPWDLKSLISGPMLEVRNALNQASRGKTLIEARLYGYDRYGLASSTCSSSLNCGFHLRLRNVQAKSLPKNVMSEFGWNASTIIKMFPDIVTDLNNVMVENLNEKVEVKVLRSGIVTIFDYDIEVEVLTVSDSIFRALYYLMAIRSAMNYVKFYGLEKRFLLLLEEPEAHTFPFFLNLFADYVAKATDVLYVVITTHNPILVSMLWDKIKYVRTYYVIRDKDGSTKALEIDMDKLAEEVRTAEDILLMPPHEVISKYSVGTKHAEPKMR